ncbi:MAG TPA: hypothetical protein VMR41_00035 [Patescibacteria group bacterium]|nr:hypothetical protein [Patescibacteria group bacterium]
MNILLFLILFIVSVFLAFYVPGRVLLGKQDSLSRLGIFVTAIILGIVMWGWQGFIFGFLQLRWLSYLYLLIFLFIFIKNGYLKFEFNTLKDKPHVLLNKIDWVTGGIIILGVIGQIIPFIRSGEMSPSGLFFSSYNTPDHIWHVTLVNELVRRFPPNEPGLYGVALINYHFWFHLVTAELIRVFHLPIFQTQFIGMYTLGPILLGLVAYVFAKAISDSKLFLRLFIFFLYFSGDAAGWFMLLLRQRFDLNVQSLFEDGSKFMDAPGRGFAIIIALAALYLFYKYRQTVLKRRNILILALLLGSLLDFKVYVGIPFLFGLFCLAIYYVIKKQFSYLWLFLTALVIGLVQYLPFNSSSGGITFLPFEIPRAFIAQKVFNLSYIDQRWTIYLQHHNYLRLLQYGVFMTTIYILVMFGIKVFGFVIFKRVIRKVGTPFFILLYSVLFISTVLGLFFYQKVGGANIWEFFMTGSLILAIITSLNLSLFLSQMGRRVVTVIIAIIIIFTIPRWINSVGMYIYDDYFSGFHGVSTSELTAYTFLKDNTPENSTILLIGKNDFLPFSSLASVLSERNLFFSGTGVSQVITPEFLRRQTDTDFIKSSKNNKLVLNVLQKDKVNYVVIENDSPIATNSPMFRNKLLSKVFSNQYSKILKVE